MIVFCFSHFLTLSVVATPLPSFIIHGPPSPFGESCLLFVAHEREMLLLILCHRAPEYNPMRKNLRVRESLGSSQCEPNMQTVKH